MINLMCQSTSSKLHNWTIDTVGKKLLIFAKYLQCRPFASYTHGC